MHSRKVVQGLALLAAGLFATTLSSLAGRFALFGTLTDVAIGFFHGLAAVAFLGAIVMLVRGAQTSKTSR